MKQMNKFIIWVLIITGAVRSQNIPKKVHWVQFWFYSHDPKGGVSETLDNFNASKTYDPKLPTNIITHGFQSSCSKMAMVMQAFQETGHFNNICVDWDAQTSIIQFFKARSLTPKIAKQIASMIAGLKMNPVHCIGHSLGAHICHLAAAKLKQETGRKMERVTLLDPAVIQGTTIEESAKKIKENIELTDVIHTNIGKIIFAGISGKHLGYAYPMGDYDFYPNGGVDQPPCNQEMKCEHSISYRYFAEAIRNPKAFSSHHCDSLQRARDHECLISEVYMGNSETYKKGKPGIYRVHPEYLKKIDIKS